MQINSSKKPQGAYVYFVFMALSNRSVGWKLSQYRTEKAGYFSAWHMEMRFKKSFSHVWICCFEMEIGCKTKMLLLYGSLIVLLVLLQEAGMKCKILK